ncbi:MAG TPA: TlpA disulfide reductase family protein [Gemmatimonadaceae bacterium]|nr:TlpA disulfide reductase family protein [Gemmatimonadaceae bacterium]
MRLGVILTAALSSSLAGSALAQDVGLPVGATAPASVVVESLDGARVDLGRWIGKQPVLLQFWATWCSSCKELEPSFRRAQTRYGSKVRFVGVAVSVNQSPERVRLYKARHKLPHDIFYDRAGNATDAFEVPATSYVVVLDRSGKVVYTGVGGDQDLEKAVARALE